MKKLQLLVASILLVLLAGCGALSGTHIVCTEQRQAGCTEHRALNVLYNDNNQQHVALKTGGTITPTVLWDGFVAGQEQPAVARDFYFLIAAVDAVELRYMSAYVITTANNKYKHTVTKTSFEDVTGQVTLPQFDPVSGVSGFKRVIRVRATGTGVIGVSLQLPDTMVDANTFLLICRDGRDTVFPDRINANKGQGIWGSDIKRLNIGAERRIRYGFVSLK